MAGSSCCNARRAARTTPRSSPLRAALRRSLGVAVWLAPGVVLAALPKCPLCLAGWVAAVSGLGVSMSVAGWLRDGVWTAGALLLVLLATRQVRRMVDLRRAAGSDATRNRSGESS